MPFAYLEDSVTSDVTFRVWGASLDHLFRDAADATTNAMVDTLDSIRPLVSVSVSVTSETLDLLLMRFLDEIIFHTDAGGLLLRATAVIVDRRVHLHRVRAELRGEPVDPDRHALAVDVKAVTLHGLRVERTASGWEAQVTLDV